MRESGAVVSFLNPIITETSLLSQAPSSSVTILLRSINNQINDSLRITPFIIVPRDELQKVFVQGDTGGGVENARVGVAYEVGGDDGVLGV